MKFSDTVIAARALLQRKGRITYKGLAREFDLDGATLQDLIEELIDGERIAVDEGGKTLAWADPSRVTAAELALANEGERRQLTVMFCDLVGSTALSEQLDPEDLHELIGAYQQAIRQVIHRFEGHVAQYLGDGILAYFGYPAAHEDDVLRGVQAGMTILTDISALKTRVPVQVRIGIHTGLVVIGSVGEGVRAEQMALGKTPNIAARVQSAARPHTLAISADTHRLVHSLLDCEDLGVHTLKGITEPLALYQVRQVRARNRFDASLAQGLSPMHGRASEMQALQLAWQQACAGQGQAVWLRGEAGVGKSRLVHALNQTAERDAVKRLVLRASSMQTNTPFYPVIEHINWALQATAEGMPDAPLTRLQHLLLEVGLSGDEPLYLVAHLLSIPLPDGFEAPILSREERKARLLQALSTLLVNSAANGPLLLIFEDLHWADPSTLDLLTLAMRRLRGTTLLMILTSRPELTPVWDADAPCTTLSVPRLSAQDVRQLALQIAGKPLPEVVLAQLMRRSDGVPLYVEEMTKDVLESSLLHETPEQFELKGDFPHMAVPDSLQDSLASRLDRLGPARRLAEIAAVLGREFSLGAIRAVSDADDMALVTNLNRLCDAGVVVREVSDHDTQYVFRHALLQDAAYNSLLLRRRQQTHARIARLFSTLWADRAERNPAVAAHHCTEAGLVQQAVTLWQKAGLRAVESSANKEAIQHVSKALEVLRSLPEGEERDRQELSLLMALGVPLAVTTSWASPKVRQASERAYELCEQLNESSQMFQAMFGVWSNRQVQAEYGAAQLITHQLLSLAQRANDDGLVLQAHRASGIIDLHMGRFEQALAHCEAGYALYDRQRHHAHVAMYWLDPGVGCLCYGAWAMLHLGRIDQAVARAEQAVELARAGGHAFSQSYALFFCAVFHYTRRDSVQTRHFSQQFLELSTAHGFPHLRAWAVLFLGAALVEEGQTAAGREMIVEGERGTRAGGSRLARSGALSVLAWACACDGKTDEGLAVVAEALDFCAQSEERFYEAELHRLQGVLLLQRNGDAGPTALQVQAMQSFEQCQVIAAQQQAVVWQLRGATAMAGLLLTRGDTTAARTLLADALRRVSKGQVTADVLEAEALLQRMGAALVA